jgi:hypothetical protein
VLYSQWDFTTAPIYFNFTSHFLHLYVHLDFTWGRGKIYLVFSIVEVCEEAPDVQEPQDVQAACSAGGSMAQVRAS